MVGICRKESYGIIGKYWNFACQNRPRSCHEIETMNILLPTAANLNADVIFPLHLCAPPHLYIVSANAVPSCTASLLSFLCFRIFLWCDWELLTSIQYPMPGQPFTGSMTCKHFSAASLKEIIRVRVKERPDHYWSMNVWLDAHSTALLIFRAYHSYYLTRLKHSMTNNSRKCSWTGKSSVIFIHVILPVQYIMCATRLTGITSYLHLPNHL